MKSCRLQAGNTDASHRAGSLRRRTPERIAGSALMALLLTASVVVAVSATLHPARETSVESWVAVTVPAGGTLWDLAESHSVPGLDTPAIVQLIEERNTLASTTVYQGQTILVPGAPDAPPVADSGLAVAAR